MASTYLPLHHHHLEIMLLLLTVNRLHTLLLSNQLTSPHPLHAPLGLPNKTHTSQQHFVHYKYALEIHCCMVHLTLALLFGEVGDILCLRKCSFYKTEVVYKKEQAVLPVSAKSENHSQKNFHHSDLTPCITEKSCPL